MGVLAATEDKNLPARFTVYGLTALYALLTFATASRHEPWADEAQSWLLSRDASLWDLWTQFLHYEGTPGLWQTLLHGLIRLGLPYEALNFVSAGLGLASAWVLLRHCSLPLFARALLPFSYFLCYQYSVIARSYCLLPLLMFAAAFLMSRQSNGTQPQRIWLLLVLLILMAAVSVHGFVLSLSLAIVALVNWRHSLPKGKIWQAAVTYVLAAVLIASAAYPAKDGVFVTRLNFSAEHVLRTLGATFAQAFTGEPLSSFVLVALSLPFLFQGGGLTAFLLGATFLCGVNSLIYSQVWHQGLLFIVWVVALWLSASRVKLPPLTYLAIMIVAAIQCYQTALAIRYDLRQPYSGSLAAAQFLKASEIPSRTVYGIGYACVALQPYFAHNIFPNFRGGADPAFWDWSSRNHSLADLERLASLNPEYVVVGYTNLAEKILWSHDVRMGGYEKMRHFEGNLFWKTDIFEPASFDLYRRRATAAHAP